MVNHGLQPENIKELRTCAVSGGIVGILKDNGMMAKAKLWQTNNQYWEFSVIGNTVCPLGMGISPETWRILAYPMLRTNLLKLGVAVRFRWEIEREMGNVH